MIDASYELEMKLFVEMPYQIPITANNGPMATARYGRVFRLRMMKSEKLVGSLNI